MIVVVPRGLPRIRSLLMTYRVLMLATLFGVLPRPVASRTWTVAADGSGDVPTIAAALDTAVAGDEILLAPGAYFEHDLPLVDGVSLRGTSLDPQGTILDAQELGRVLNGFGVGEGTTVEGVTLTRGRTEGDCSDPGTGAYCMGGAALLVDAAPTFLRCVFLECHAEDNGGAIASVLSAPTLTDCRFESNTARHGAAISFVSSSRAGATPSLTRCIFAGNAAEADGGAVYAYVSDPLLSLCTFDENSAGEQGSAMFWYEPTPPIMDRCVVAFGHGIDPIFSGIPGTGPTLSCCDVFGNEGGNFVGCLTGQDVVSGNFSADPLFCGAAAFDVGLQANSPCAPGATSCGSVGAADVMCAATSAPGGIEPSSWGRVKASHRTGR